MAWRWAALLVFGIAPGEDAAAAAVLEAKTYHLGVRGAPEWEEFAASPPDARRLDLRFPARANERAATLLIRQRDVKQTWPVRLNDRPIGQLELNEQPLVVALEVPAGVLQDGENHLAIEPPATADDVLVGPFALVLEPRERALDQATLAIDVVAVGDGRRGLPCRITIEDEQGALAPLVAKPGQRLAVRAGVAYTPNGRARIGVRPGRYTVHATRGFEYGLDSRTVTVAAGESRELAMAIRREVPTSGLASSDTHIHTFTYSRHGDATVDERAVTLAGEGVELPIATDHNTLTDLAPAAERMGVRGHFTPVVGDEVTTRVGHFNAFAFGSSEQVPDSSSDDWGRIVRGIRAGSAARVIVLNHPRDRHGEYRPFDREHFNPVSGEHARAADLRGIDALEVVNSGAMQSDPMQTLRDWLALLNHGGRLTAVGASDSHDVSRFIVGQGRTYIACRDDDPAHLDVAEACRSLREGRALVSLGLLVRLSVDDRYQVGDLATGLGDSIRVSLAVLGPSWTSADHLALYVNGTLAREQVIVPSRGVEKARVVWTLPRPRGDAHLVAIASGPGVRGLYWPIARPYQPTSRAWTPRVLGATNPVYLDADADGVYTSPRARAAELVGRVGTDPAPLLAALEPFDEATAAQAASLCHARGRDPRSPDYRRPLASAPLPIRRGFAAYSATLERSDPSHSREGE